MDLSSETMQFLSAHFNNQHLQVIQLCMLDTETIEEHMHRMDIAFCELYDIEIPLDMLLSDNQKLVDVPAIVKSQVLAIRNRISWILCRK